MTITRTVVEACPALPPPEPLIWQPLEEARVQAQDLAKAYLRGQRIHGVNVEAMRAYAALWRACDN